MTTPHDQAPQRTAAGRLLWLLLGLVVLFFMYPHFLVGWPPASLERHRHRKLLNERVQSTGGWDVIRNDCVAFAKEHTNGFHSFWNDTNLPPAILALKPMIVDYDPYFGRVRMRIFGGHSTGGHSVPYFGLEVVTDNRDGYKPGEGYGGGVIGNRHTTFREVASGIYEIY
jgi:hypothetical protein